jgi:MoaA/NifB/PqqE/SkfB family radical SAM enzyme
MQNHIKTHKEELERRLPARFPGMEPLPEGFRNSTRGWPVKSGKPGCYTADVEHVPDRLAAKHNDGTGDFSLLSGYHPNLCIHRCPSCFSEQDAVYAKRRADGSMNPIMTMSQTFGVIDKLMAIAESEGHTFESVKFLGPGELLMNPELFDIIEEYAKRGITIGIFTKGALLGSDALARKYQGHKGMGSAKEFVDRLAACGNVTLLFSFQSFDPDVQQSLVSRRVEKKMLGLRGYAGIRLQALEDILASGFYSDGMTDRICIANTPIVPENIEESFDIYRFFIERGTPVVMTPTMVSGLGLVQLGRQRTGMNSFQERLIELYAEVYGYNIRKGIQTIEQIVSEGIASYVGAAPCSQASNGFGLIRANGRVDMCPGRADGPDSIFGNVMETSPAEIWAKSLNRMRGMDPHNLVNNGCPAKDATSPEQNACRPFPYGFYERVMSLLMETL